MANTIVDFTGNRIEGGLGVGFRMEPAVNTITIISSNQFIANNNTALIIRNARYPQLYNLPAQVFPFFFLLIIVVCLLICLITYIFDCLHVQKITHKHEILIFELFLIVN